MAFGVTQLHGFGASAASGSLASFTNCVNITGTPTAAGYGVYTIVSKFLTPVLAASGSICRITLTGPSVGGQSISAMYIGQGATSGNAYDFDGGQVQVLFGGSGSRFLATSEVVISDDVTFAITGAKPILIAFNLNTAASNLARITGLSSNYINYQLGAVAEAATSAKSAGYEVQASRIHCTFKIEVA